MHTSLARAALTLDATAVREASPDDRGASEPVTPPVDADPERREPAPERRYYEF